MKRKQHNEVTKLSAVEQAINELESLELGQPYAELFRTADSALKAFRGETAGTMFPLFLAPAADGALRDFQMATEAIKRDADKELIRVHSEAVAGDLRVEFGDVAEGSSLGAEPGLLELFGHLQKCACGLPREHCDAVCESVCHNSILARKRAISRRSPRTFGRTKRPCLTRQL